MISKQKTELKVTEGRENNPISDTDYRYTDAFSTTD